jgi:hypothetical protein
MYELLIAQAPTERVYMKIMGAGCGVRGVVPRYAGVSTQDIQWQRPSAFSTIHGLYIMT